MHCACVRAAQRSLQQQQAALLRQQQEAEEQQRQLQLRQQLLAAQTSAQRFRSAHAPVRRHHSYSGAIGQQLIFPLPQLRPNVRQQQQQGSMPPTPDPSTPDPTQVRAASAANPAVDGHSTPHADQPLPRTHGSVWAREAVAGPAASRNHCWPTGLAPRAPDALGASHHAQTPNTHHQQQHHHHHHLLRGGNTTTSPQQHHREHQQALAAQVAQMFAERQQRRRQQQEQRMASSAALLPPAPTLPAAPVAGLSASAPVAGLIQQAADAFADAATDAYPIAVAPPQASAAPASATQAPPGSRASSRSQLHHYNTHSCVPTTAAAAGVPSSHATPAASAAAAAAAAHYGDVTDAEDSGSFAAAPQHQHPLLCTHHHHPGMLDHTAEAAGPRAVDGGATGATTDALRSMPCGTEAGGSFAVSGATAAPLSGAAAAGPAGAKQPAATSAVLPLRYMAFPHAGMPRGGSSTTAAAAAAPSSAAPSSSDAVAAATAATAAARPGRSSGIGAFRLPGCFSFPRGLPTAISEADRDGQHRSAGPLTSPSRMYGSAQQPAVRIQLRSAPYVQLPQPQEVPAGQLPSVISAESTVRGRDGKTTSSSSSQAAHSGAGGSGDAVGSGRKLLDALLPVAGFRRLKAALAQRFGASDEAYGGVRVEREETV